MGQETKAELVVQQWMSIKEVCQLSRLSRGAIYNEINAGRLASFHVGKSRRFLPQDVAAWQAIYSPPRKE